jgi:hypothetical protein
MSSSGRLWVAGLCLIGGLALFMFGDRASAVQADALEIRRPYGYVEAGRCMSREQFRLVSERAIYNVDWSKIQGSTDFDRGTVARIWVFKSMKRLGTPACADLASLYRILEGWAAKPLIGESDLPSRLE